MSKKKITPAFFSRHDISKLSEEEIEERISTLVTADGYHKTAKWESGFTISGVLSGILTAYVERLGVGIGDPYFLTLYVFLIPGFSLSIPLAILANRYKKKYFRYRLASWWSVALVPIGINKYKENVYYLTSGTSRSILAWMIGGIVTTLFLR